MNSDVLRGKTALVTGASSGLGADFARQLAAMGCNLILVARREGWLQSVREETQKQHAVKIEIMAMDLSETDAPQVLYERVQAAGLNVDVLVNNAGFGLYGAHMSIPWEKEREMLTLDIVALMQLTKLFARDMLARNSGYILQVSSVAGYQSSPTYAAYSAAKSFVLLFGEAFNFELRNTGVSCTVLSPGITATGFLKAAGQTPSLYQRLFMMQSPAVVRTGLKAMLKRRPSVIAGWLNAFVAWSTRFIPRRWATAIAYVFMTVQ